MLAHEGLGVAQAAADAANAHAKAVRQSLEEVQEKLRTAEGLLRATEQELARERSERAALQRQGYDGAPVCQGGTVAAQHFWQT